MRILLVNNLIKAVYFYFISMGARKVAKLLGVILSDWSYFADHAVPVLNIII